MIKHIVFFSAKDQKDIPVIKEALLGYRNIPSVSNLEVHENLKKDDDSSEIDIILTVEFESLEDMDEYKKHPIFKEGINTIRPLRNLRFVADFKS